MLKNRRLENSFIGGTDRKMGNHVLIQSTVLEDVFAQSVTIVLPH
jgi:hypothetical protein